MPPTKLQNLITSHLFKTRNAFVEAIAGSIVLTGMMTLANMDKWWVLNSDFHILFTFISNTAIIFSVLSYSFSIIRSKMKLEQKHAFVIIGAIIIAILISLLSNKIHAIIHNDDRFSDYGNIYLIRDVGTAIISILFALILYNLSRRHQHRIENEQLLAENLLVRYETLENQLDPHFLFNSLNTLSGLIESNNDKAQNYLQQLASTYRYIMKSRRLVSLEEELQFVKSYCEMIKMRYGENINFEWHVAPQYLQYQIIPISIQLLIENAMKHNIVSNRYPLDILLSTRDDATFHVSNIIRPKQVEDNSTGLGLANLSKRYQLLCDKEITITNNNGIFEVGLPLLNPSEAAKIAEKLSFKNTNK